MSIVLSNGAQLTCGRKKKKRSSTELQSNIEGKKETDADALRAEHSFGPKSFVRGILIRTADAPDIPLDDQGYCVHATDT